MTYQRLYDVKLESESAESGWFRFPNGRTRRIAWSQIRGGKSDARRPVVHVTQPCFDELARKGLIEVGKQCGLQLMRKINDIDLPSTTELEASSGRVSLTHEYLQGCIVVQLELISQLTLALQHHGRAEFRHGLSTAYDGNVWHVYYQGKHVDAWQDPSCPSVCGHETLADALQVVEQIMNEEPHWFYWKESK